MNQETFNLILHNSIAKLVYIIENWKEQETDLVLLAYADLVRRRHKLNEGTMQQISDFCAANNHEEIEYFLKSAMEKQGFNSYMDYFKDRIQKTSQINNPIENTSKSSYNKDSTIKYPALLIIIVIYRIIGALLLLITLVAIFGQSIFGLVFIPVTLVLSLVCFSAAELIKIFMDIEKNTRSLKS
jgi:hypothetical protein